MRPGTVRLAASSPAQTTAAKTKAAERPMSGTRRGGRLRVWKRAIPKAAADTAPATASVGPLRNPSGTCITNVLPETREDPKRDFTNAPLAASRRAAAPVGE